MDREVAFICATIPLGLYILPLLKVDLEVSTKLVNYSSSKIAEKCVFHCEHPLVIILFSFNQVFF